MAVTQQKLLPIAPSEVREALRLEYTNLHGSDIYCLYLLSMQGKLEISRNRTTRHLVLSPAPDVAQFVDEVFGISEHQATPQAA